MNYADYQRAQVQSATPLFRPLEAPAVPPPIVLEPKTSEELGDGENGLVVRLLSEHIMKQDVSYTQREIKELQAELCVVRNECEALLAQSGKVRLSPPETLLQGALRSRSGSSA